MDMKTMIVINSTFTKIKYPLSAGFELSIQCPQYQWERKTDHIELNSNTTKKCLLRD